MTPRVLVLADVPSWAWGRKAAAYRSLLADRFDITVAYHAAVPNFADFDLVHLFEVSQVGVLSAYPKPHRGFKAVAGLTAHVWWTWGGLRMAQWATQVDGLHGNSVLLVKELQPFHPRVFYTPNGVDPVLYRRQVPLPDRVTFGHVGKPNPRKGGDLIVEAARAAGVELRLIQRTSKLALSEQQMIDWYQGISVMVTASNMDGTPNPMLEGAACECALLSTPIGNMPEFIKTGINGYLTQAALPLAPPYPAATDDPATIEKGRQALREELINAMRLFAQDHDYTTSMGKEAANTVRTGWTWAHQVEHVATMWQEVLG